MIRYVSILTVGLLIQLHTLQAQVLINEFMASNQGAVTDSFGNSSDWIELYNFGNLTVDLEGWHLSDNPENPEKWTFPAMEISPQSHLLLFASGANISDGFYQHTNFRLSATGENLMLTNSSLELIDSIGFTHQFTDISNGRKTDGSPDWVFFDMGTPEANNAGGIVVEPVANTVLFSHGPGTYKEDIDLEMIAPMPHHVIFFSLDGTQPDTNANLYTGPLNLSEENLRDIHLSHIPTGIGWYVPEGEINRCHVIRAQAYANGQAFGEEHKATFFIWDEGDDRYTMPLLSIITNPYNLFDPDSGIYHRGHNENYFERGKNWERLAHIEYFDKDGELEHHQDLGIRVTGGASRNRPQKSLKFYAREEYGSKKIDYPFFGNVYGDDFKRLSIRGLKNNWTPTAINDDFAHEFSKRNQMDYEYQYRKFVVVFINGEYWGVHSLRETSEEFMIGKRFGIDDDDIIIGGDIWTENRWWLEGTDMSAPGKFEEISELIDVDNFIDYYIAEIFFANTDWPQNNFKIWKEDAPESRWRWVFYDLDGGFQNYKSDVFTQFFEPEELHIREERFHGFTTLRALLNNEEFRARFRSMMIYHLNHTFLPEFTIPVYKELAADLRPEIKEHQRRWNYPNRISRWERALVNTEDFLTIRGNILLLEMFERLGIPMEIFPNPVDRVASGEIELARPQSVRFLLTSTDGTMVLLAEQNLTEGKNQFSFDVSKWDSGTYILSALTQSQLYSKKLVILHH